MSYPFALVVIPLGGTEELVTDEDIETAIQALQPFKAHAVTDRDLVTAVVNHIYDKVVKDEGPH